MSFQNFNNKIGGFICLMFVGFIFFVIGATGSSPGVIIFGLFMIIGGIGLIVKQSNSSKKPVSVSKPRVKTSRVPHYSQKLQNGSHYVNTSRKTVSPPVKPQKLPSCADCQGNFANGYKFCTTCGKSRQQWISEQSNRKVHLAPKISSISSYKDKLTSGPDQGRIKNMGFPAEVDKNPAIPSERKLQDNPEDLIHDDGLMDFDDSHYHEEFKHIESPNLTNTSVVNTELPVGFSRADFTLRVVDFPLPEFDSEKIKFDKLKNLEINEFTFDSDDYNKKIN